MKNFKLVKTTAALALGASVVTAAVVPGTTSASAASKYKVSNGKLVNAKTGKVVKGYVVFKSKLYYNGKLKKGYKTVGSGKTIKLYYNGSLKKGYKTARNSKLLFFNGSLKKGYKSAGSGERLYKDGFLAKGYEVYGDVDKNPKLYYNGYLKSGYKTANNATLLFYNGELKKGYKTAKEGTVLYKDGRLNEGLVELSGVLYDGSKQNEGKKLFEGTLYDGAKRAIGLVKFEEKYYNDGVLANGEFVIDGEKVTIENGVLVGADKEAPVLTVAGGVTTVTVENGEKLDLPEVTATDNKDKEVEVKSVITDADGKELKEIDTKVAGTYTVTYSAEDAAGNKAENVVVTVVVKEGAFKVETVSAITKTGVTLNIKKLDKDVEGATITVKDNNGNIVEVTPLNLVINETVANFKFKTPLTSEPTGVWTIEGISYDTDVAAQLDEINSANTELKLYNALTAAGIKNLVVKNSSAYKAADKPADGFKTLEEVQAFVDKVNASQLTAAEQAEKVDALAKALENGSQVLVLDALKSWSQVNESTIATYIDNLKAMNSNQGPLKATENEFKNIQTVLDNANVAAATTAVNTAKNNAKRADYDKAVKAMNFVREDDSKVSTDKVKANLQKDLDLLNKVLNVKEASTAAQLANAYNALVAQVDNKSVIGSEQFYTDLRTKYMDATKALAATETETVKTAADIENAIVKVNTQKRAELYNAVAQVVDSPEGSATKTADVLKKLQDLAAYADKADFDIKTVNTSEDSLKAYRTAFTTLTTISSPSTESASNVTTMIKAVQTKVNNVNDAAVTAPLTKLEMGTEVGGVFHNGTSEITSPAEKEAALLATLKATGLKNIEDANSSAYLAVYDEIKTAASGAKTTPDEIASVKSDVQNIVNAENARIELNAASTDTAAQAALTRFAIATGNNDFINLSSTSKLEVAGLVNSNKPTNGYENKTAVNAAITAQDTARTGLITGVNNASTITEYNSALGSLDYKPFEDLSASQKIAVAEAFRANVPKDKDNAKILYTNLTNIKADIDKAITAVAE